MRRLARASVTAPGSRKVRQFGGALQQLVGDSCSAVGAGCPDFWGEGSADDASADADEGAVMTR